LMFYQC